MTTITVEWYRDKSNGQYVSDMTLACEVMDIWPIAVIPCMTYTSACRLQEYLYYTYGIHATTVVNC